NGDLSKGRIIPPFPIPGGGWLQPRPTKPETESERMLRRASRHVLSLVALVIVCAFTVVGVRGQSGATKGEWPNYGADKGHTRYSPLDQINADNFSKLAVAWRFNTAHLGARPEYNLEATPLMVNGVLYTTAGSRRAVVAL